jgi:GT2 family glycosyltransferase
MTFNAPVSIIIVNYKVKDLLFLCLKSIYSFSSVETEIWVVDNNSGDGTAEMLKTDFPSVNFIGNNFNAGFPAANNQALKRCSGQYIFLLNPDTEFLSDCIPELIRFSKSRHDNCILAPQLLNTDGTVQFSIQPFISFGEILLEVFYLHNFLQRSKSYLRKNIQHPLQIDAASGAALFFHRSVMEKIGMLDEELFWTEDMEYCYRASKHQIERYYLPGVKITHHIGQSGKKNPGVMISNQLLTKIRYFYKTKGAFAGGMVAFMRFIQVIIRILILYPLSVVKPALRQRADGYVYTLKRLIKGDF